LIPYRLRRWSKYSAVSFGSIGKAFSPSSPWGLKGCWAFWGTESARLVLSRAIPSSAINQDFIMNSRSVIVSNISSIDGRYSTRSSMPCPALPCEWAEKSQDQTAPVPSEARACDARDKLFLSDCVVPATVLALSRSYQMEERRSREAEQSSQTRAG
jgi:hypothetical protein